MRTARGLTGIIVRRPFRTLAQAKGVFDAWGGHAVVSVAVNNALADIDEPTQPPGFHGRLAGRRDRPSAISGDF